MSSIKLRTAALLAALLAVSACGDTTAEQAILGAGGGAVAGEVIANDPITGAVVGAAGNVLYCDQNPGRC